MMDIDEINNAIHEISMMVSVLLDAQDSMQAPDTNPSVFQMSRAAGEMVCFAALDIDKRVTALRDAMNRPTATVVPIGGKGCA
jgi:hypothetical protein